MFLPSPGYTVAPYRHVGTRAWSSENQFVLRDRHPFEQLLVPVEDERRNAGRSPAG